VKAVALKFVRRDVVPNVVGLCGLDQQISDQMAEALLSK